MKFSVACTQCLMESGKPVEMVFNELVFNDHFVWDYSCQRGHKTVVTVLEQKYDILFEIGCNALLDGYTDAAVTRFAVSLERFYEFYIKVMLFKQGLSLQDFEKMWKQMSKQSERQFGAFLVLNELDKVQNGSGAFHGLIENKWIEFRNKVIHHGYIPSDEEARNYGRIIFDFITKMRKHLQDNYSEEINKIESERFFAIEEEKGQRVSVTTVFASNVIGHYTFEQGLETLTRHRSLIKEFS